MQHGYITEEEYNLASNQDISFSLQYIERTSDDPNQAYITQTLSEVMELTGQDPAIIPMDIYTALNQDAQKQADEICNGNIVQYPDEAFDVGFSMIENDTGEIIAGRDLDAVTTLTLLKLITQQIQNNLVQQ